MKVCLRGVPALAAGLAALALAPAAPAQDVVNPAPAKAATERVLRLPDKLDNYASLDLPAHFKTPGARRFDNTPTSNPVTDAGATLGRVLFYDTRLSANNTTACASCHLQKNAFADPARFSKGFEGKLVDRHAMPLGNLRFYGPGRFFWDERAPTLEAQVLMPIQSKVEMGMILDRLMDVLSKDEHYPKLFKQAFGTDEITKERTARALAQFLRSMVSYRSKYDVGRAKVDSVRDDFPNFTSQENQGKNTFLNRCATCHKPGGQDAHFFMTRPLNNRLDVDFRKTDGGVGALTLRPGEMGLFKSPSLRNVEFTAPYMHDGRFPTLEKVIEHYAQGVKNHPNLDGRARRGGINPGQRAALVAFLKTLSDREFITDPKYSDPFVTLTAGVPNNK
jgi:cytochrome c peroxidase